MSFCTNCRLIFSIWCLGDVQMHICNSDVPSTTESVWRESSQLSYSTVLMRTYFVVLNVWLIWVISTLYLIFNIFQQIIFFAIFVDKYQKNQKYLLMSKKIKIFTNVQKKFKFSANAKKTIWCGKCANFRNLGTIGLFVIFNKVRNRFRLKTY